MYLFETERINAVGQIYFVRDQNCTISKKPARVFRIAVFFIPNVHFAEKIAYIEFIT